MQSRLLACKHACNTSTTPIPKHHQHPYQPPTPPGLRARGPEDHRCGQGQGRPRTGCPSQRNGAPRNSKADGLAAPWDEAPADRVPAQGDRRQPPPVRVGAARRQQAGGRGAAGAGRRGARSARAGVLRDGRQCARAGLLLPGAGAADGVLPRQHGARAAQAGDGRFFGCVAARRCFWGCSLCISAVLSCCHHHLVSHPPFPNPQPPQAPTPTPQKRAP